jgi:acetyltransferase-like isoleucine patch superfamily enzyme
MFIKKIFNKFIINKDKNEPQFYWENKFFHNSVLMGNLNCANVFETIDKIFIGKKTYGTINILDHVPQKKASLIIGSYVSIAKNVQFLLGAEHALNTISTYPFKVKNYGYKSEAYHKGDIVINDDVWIGTNVIICGGIKIGQGAVVAAGSVVTKNVEPYSIVGGNPAKHIKFRFSENLRERLLKIDITKLFDSFNENDIDIIYEPLTEDILDKMILKLINIS